MSQFFVPANSIAPSPPTVPTKFTTNDGNFSIPSSNNLNVFGNNIANNGFATWTTSNPSDTGNTNTINSYGNAKWVVNPTAGVGTHQTISAAVASASAGDTIFVTPGSYTESPSISVSLTIVGYGSMIGSLGVTVNGQFSISAGATVILENLNLSNSSGSIATLTGSATQLVVENCQVNGTNGQVSFNVSASLQNLWLINCYSSGSAGQLFSLTNGNMWVWYSSIQSYNSSSTVGTGGNLDVRYSRFDVPLTISSTGAFDVFYTQFGPHFTPYINQTWITVGGTFTGNYLEHCELYSGTQSAVYVNSGCSLTMSDCTINSSASYALAGPGTLSYSNLTYTGSSNLVNINTQNPLITQAGALNVIAPSVYPYTAVGTDCVIAVNTSSAANTITLPASPSKGQYVRIKDKSANASAYNITVSGNGHNIVGTTSASTYVINTNGGSIDLAYDSLDSIWLVL